MMMMWSRMLFLRNKVYTQELKGEYKKKCILLLFLSIIRDRIRFIRVSMIFFLSIVWTCAVPFYLEVLPNGMLHMPIAVLVVGNISFMQSSVNWEETLYLSIFCSSFLTLFLFLVRQHKSLRGLYLLIKVSRFFAFVLLSFNRQQLSLNKQTSILYGFYSHSLGLYRLSESFFWIWTKEF